jgi:hypothetical protein
MPMMIRAIGKTSEVPRTWPDWFMTHLFTLYYASDLEKVQAEASLFWTKGASFGCARVLRKTLGETR